MGDKKMVENSRESVNKKITASGKFVVILALVSIVGFVSIVSETLFNYALGNYIEGLWLLIIGIGMVIEGQVTRLKQIKKEGLTPRNFTHLITVIIGFLAIIAGIFSFPFLRIEASGFLAVKGIIALIAIIIIVVQTWVVE